jgi:hypothetical protein
MRALTSRLCPAIALCFPVAALAAPAGDSDLLDLPFEDLLEVKISSAVKRLPIFASKERTSLPLILAILLFLN